MVERAFRLQGLLNLRHLQEEQAAGHLASAHADLNNADKRLGEARERLSHMSATGTDLAVAAAMRDAARMQIQEGIARKEYAKAVVEQRQEEWMGAKRKAATLEKLENRHNEAVIADELHWEQLALDELASHRGNTAKPVEGAKIRKQRENFTGQGGKQWA